MKTKAPWEVKLDWILDLDSPVNYLCVEDAQEGILDEFSDDEQYEHCDDINDAVAEWWDANEGDSDDDN